MTIRLPLQVFPKRIHRLIWELVHFKEASSQDGYSHNIKEDLKQNKNKITVETNFRKSCRLSPFLKVNLAVNCQGQTEIHYVKILEKKKKRRSFYKKILGMIMLPSLSKITNYNCFAMAS